MENKMDNLEITTLNNNETAEMLIRGIEMKIEELFSNAENAKKSGNGRAWANYLPRPKWLGYPWLGGQIVQRPHWSLWSH